MKYRLPMLLAAAPLTAAFYLNSSAIFEQGFSREASVFSEAHAQPSDSRIGKGLPETMGVKPLDDEFFNDKGRQVPVANQRSFETAGYLTDSISSTGSIKEGENPAQVTFSTGDVLYIDLGEADGVKTNAKYLVLHLDGEEVIHPVTAKSMGHRVIVDGIIEVTEVNAGYSKAKVSRSYDGIMPGYKLRPLEKQDAPVTDFDRPVKDKTITGVVITGKEDRKAFSRTDIIYIDAGSSAGVETGDIFDIATLKTSAFVPDKDDEKSKTAIKRAIGAARVISVEQNTCTAEVISSQHVIRPGDFVKYVMEREHGKPAAVKGER